MSMMVNMILSWVLAVVLFCSCQYFTDGFSSTSTLITSLTIRTTRHSVQMMAQLPYKQPVKHNVAGNVYVDTSCIDCDVCRWMCPSVFGRKALRSFVQKQPINENEKLLAYSAMLACPVGAIRTNNPDPLVKKAHEVFPVQIDPINIPNIYHVGYHAVSSFGAIPYLIKRRGGNVMIDCPRYNSKLASNIEAEGGIHTMILTHADDIADHQKWKEHFPKLQRVIHRLDKTQESADMEIVLDGVKADDWEVDNDIHIFHTPGHTPGSLSILVKTKHFTNRKNADEEEEKFGDTVLFSGDTLAHQLPSTFSSIFPPSPAFAEKDEDEEQYKLGKLLTGFKAFNHGSIRKQEDTIRSLASNRKFPFTWLLPAHGRMIRFTSLEEKQQAILEATELFHEEDETTGSLGLHNYYS